MAAAIVQSASNGASSTTSTVVTLGVAPTNGNILLAFVSCNANRTLTVPTGWAACGLNNSNMRLYRKIAGAAEPAATTWTVSSLDGLAVAVFEVSGANSDSAVYCPVALDPNNTTAVFSRFITLTSNDLLLVAFNIDGTAPTVTPSGFTSDQQQLIGPNALVSGHIAPPASTTFETVSVTWSHTGNCVIAAATFQATATTEAGHVYKGRDTSALDTGSAA